MSRLLKAAAAGLTAGLVHSAITDPSARERYVDYAHGAIAALRPHSPAIPPAALARLPPPADKVSTDRGSPSSPPIIVIDIDTVLVGRVIRNGAPTYELRPGTADLLKALKQGDFPVVLQSSQSPFLARSLLKGLDPDGTCLHTYVGPRLRRPLWGPVGRVPILRGLLPYGLEKAWRQDALQSLNIQDRPAMLLAAASPLPQRAAEAAFAPPRTAYIEPWDGGIRDGSLFALARWFSLSSRALAAGDDRERLFAAPFSPPAFPPAEPAQSQDPAELYWRWHDLLDPLR
jgi:hypothetical protein